MALAPGSLVAPGLRLVRAIGRGGIGSVWLAEQEGRGPVAVKFLSANAAKNALLAARFHREADAAARMSNLHVVQVYGHGKTDEDGAYVVMEYLEGESLAERLGRVGHVSLAFTAELVPQLGSALQAAHDAGLVHRDIKPGNIFLLGQPEHPTVKVLDFGVAKDMRVKNGSVVTGTGVAIGSPLTMSPEQVLGSRHVDYRSDLWAFAVVVYRLVCGRMPFLDDNPNALAFAICKGRYKPPSRLGGVPALDPWFARAFQPRKENRFDSAREQAAAFARALEREDGSLPLVDLLEESTLSGSSSLDEDTATTLPSDAVALLESVDLLDEASDDAETRTQKRELSDEQRAELRDKVAQISAIMSAPEAPAPGARQPSVPPTPDPGKTVWSTAPPAHAPPLDTPAPATPSSATGGTRTVLYAALAAMALGVVSVAAVVFIGAGGDKTPSSGSSAEEQRHGAPSTEPSVGPSAEAIAAASSTRAQAVAAPSTKATPSAEPSNDEAAGAPGKLSIICVPGCTDVRVDGQSWGPSPVFEHETGSGKREVVLYQGALRAKRLSVDVAAGEVTLERVLLDPRPPTAAPPDGGAPTPAHTSPPPPSAAPSSARAEPSPAPRAQPQEQLREPPPPAL